MYFKVILNIFDLFMKFEFNKSTIFSIPICNLFTEIL